VYEHPTTHKFAIVPLPSRFIAGDPLPVRQDEHWFDTRDDALATLRDLLNRDD
jgi:hypothetical protein